MQMLFQCVHICIVFIVLNYAGRRAGLHALFAVVPGSPPFHPAKLRFLGAKPNYPAFFALNVRITTMLRLRHRGASGIAGKVFQSMVSIVFHNRLIFNALQKAMF